LDQIFIVNSLSLRSVMQEGCSLLLHITDFKLVQMRPDFNRNLHSCC